MSSGMKLTEISPINPVTGKPRRKKREKREKREKHGKKKSETRSQQQSNILLEVKDVTPPLTIRPGSQRLAFTSQLNEGRNYNLIESNQRAYELLDEANKIIEPTAKNFNKYFKTLFPETVRYTKISAIFPSGYITPASYGESGLKLATGDIIRDWIPVEYRDYMVNAIKNPNVPHNIKQNIVDAVYYRIADSSDLYNQVVFLIKINKILDKILHKKGGYEDNEDENEDNENENEDNEDENEDNENEYNDNEDENEDNENEYEDNENEYEDNENEYNDNEDDDNEDDENNENEDKDESSDDEEILLMIDEIEPDLLALYRAQSGGGNVNDETKNVKQFADEKIVSPYLLGSFVNGELSIPQVAHLKDRRSRRRLFRELV